MALRSPIYLDLETLLALTEYHDIPVPKAMDVVERSSRGQKVGASAALSGIGVSASGGKNTEYQTSYSLSPREKAVASRAIDGIEASELLQTNATAISKGSLVQLTGFASMTACSVAAKAIFVVRNGLEATSDNLEELSQIKNPPEAVWKRAKDVYINNTPIPVPLLLELDDTGMEPQVFVSLKPEFFVDTTASDRFEGEKTVLGQVGLLVPEDDFHSTEDWLLSGFEWMVRRKMMTDIGDMIEKMLSGLDVDLPEDSVRDYIGGPALVIDAVAVY